MTVDIKDLIKEVLEAKRVPQEFRADPVRLYRELSKLLHPDTCKEPGAQEATVILNSWKDELEKGLTIKDDAGIVRYTSKWLRLEGKADLLKVSFDNWVKLKGFQDPASVHFKKLYIPQDFCVDTFLECPIEDFQIVPLRELLNKFNGSVPQVHVNWIVNRMLEFAAWLELEGYVHCGINLESVFVLPEQHGIVIPTFYHMVRVGEKLRSVSGRYMNFYPPELFIKGKNKIATTQIDTELIMRTALVLLGNPGGLAAGLRKTHNEKLLDFYSKHHFSAQNAFLEHKKLVDTLFKKEFHKLEI